MDEKLNIERRTWDIVQFRINQYTISWRRHLNHPLRVTPQITQKHEHSRWSGPLLFLVFNIQLPNMIQQLQAKRFNRNVISYTIIFISLTHTVYLIYCIHGVCSYIEATMHCGRRGGHSWSQLGEHLCSRPGPPCSRPATGHNLVRSDLDSLLNSTPFWCKNHFCSLKTEGVTKYFLATNIFPTAPS